MDSSSVQSERGDPTLCASLAQMARLDSCPLSRIKDSPHDTSHPDLRTTAKSASLIPGLVHLTRSYLDGGET